jgi:hypothetical protein
MLDTLKGMISDLHVFLYGGFRSLPLVMGGTLLILGLFTANYAILFLLIGFLVLTPIGAAIINVIIPLFINLLYYIGKYIQLKSTTGDFKELDKMKWFEVEHFSRKSTDVCKLSIPYLSSTTPASKDMETIISSPWMAMMSFFIGYVIHNAIQLYIVDTSPDMKVVTNSNTADTDVKVKNRKTQAMSALISTSVFGIIILALRAYGGCEGFIGFILTSVVFGAGGYFWYTLLSDLGQDRLSDIFGIANRILPPSAIQNGPIACVPIPAS